MEIKYIKPFVEATEAVFIDFYNIKPELQKPYLVNKKEKSNWDISGVIGIAGEAKGVVVVSFSEDIAIKLTSILIGKQINSLNDDVIDSIGEVVNIIAGNAKKGFEEQRLMISLPSVIKGANHEIVWPSSSMPIIGIPFIIQEGSFHLSIGLENFIRI